MNNLKPKEPTDKPSPSRLRKAMRNPLVWVSLALFCCLLWGSAFAAIKTGYELFQVDTQNPFAIMVFAGSRFTLAGVLILLSSLVFTRQLPLPPRSEWPKVLLYAIVQTTLHYTLFYVALANSSGVKSAILNGSNAFFVVILAHFFFKDDRFNGKKLLAIVLGLAGIIILNLKGEGFDLNFTLLGEGFMLLASLCGAFGNIMTKRLGVRTKPTALAAWQLLIGGALLILIGFVLGGRLGEVQSSAWLLLLYLAALSATAFSVWALLLRFHPMSRIGIFQALIPLIGSLGAWLILGEAFWNLQNVVALILITSSIVIINRANATRDVHEKSAE